MTTRAVWSSLLLLGVGTAVLVGSGRPVATGDEAGPSAFATPKAAAEAVVAAVQKNSDEAIKALVGPGEAGLVQSGKDPAVARLREEFVKRATEHLGIEDGEGGSKTIVIGHNRWPFPIPLVKKAAGWQLDAKAGSAEMLARRIGRNELGAIELCRAYAHAQVEYASKDRDGDEVREYARRVRSSPGKQDGLYWPDEAGGDPSPLGPLVEPAKRHLEGRAAGDPVSGYVWRILEGQGTKAPGGRHSYVINGNMTAGFALVGMPSRYGVTGVMTLLVSHHGKVYEKDLGEDTTAAVRAMLGYNPDATWSQVKED